MTNLEQKEITLAGVLVPDQWAENGEITGFALCTDDEQKYVLHHSAGKSNLISMLHQAIKVDGIVTDGTGEEKSFIVNALHLLSSHDIA